MSDFNKETKDQIAHVMLATGTDQQKIDALVYANSSSLASNISSVCNIPSSRIEADDSAPLSEMQILKQANDLLRLASKAGFVLTIEQVACKPLAMGNYISIPTVRRKR